MPRCRWLTLPAECRHSPTSAVFRSLRLAPGAHAQGNYVISEEGLGTRHADPPANRPDHGGRVTVVVQHGFAPLAPVKVPRLGFAETRP